jgi:hypothetical protein
VERPESGPLLSIRFTFLRTVLAISLSSSSTGSQLRFDLKMADLILEWIMAL